MTAGVVEADSRFQQQERGEMSRPDEEKSAESRWSALRDYLAKAVRDHEEIAVSCDGWELSGTRLDQEGRVTAYRDILAKMQEMESAP
jgi:hypothetical protein